MAATATAAPQTEPDTNVLPNNCHSTRRPSISKLKTRFQGAISHSPFGAQPNSLARRLHALLPTASSNNVPAVTVSAPPPIIETTFAPCEAPFVKIRIVSWNMHESLPKGDLDALLGAVPHYTPKGTPGNTLNIEGLSMDASHPYHIVVIAGQECPTMMGLPMGLGGGFKWSKEDDEKEKEHKEHKEHKEKEHKEKEGHKPKSTKDKDLEKDERRHSSEHIRTLDAALPAITSTPTPSIKEKEKEKDNHAMGWSAILEDYFSRGIGSGDTSPALSTPVAAPSTPKQVNSSRPTSYLSPEHLQPPACPAQPGSNNKNVVVKPPQGGPHVPHLGPYELITKERMMGLYLAVYVHRDSGDLVHGHSKSAVTAGLIGGRLGNKGGVGISVNFNGTTFLFINAHLAAHEGRKAHRLANMAKIKAELTVDPFLHPDDPRTVAEDITDRFDHTFIFGDLNFRLDVTRLHADWLVSRQEFVQAQEFDQLRQIMKSGEAFVGFKEGPINFPPTFKYDVLRTIKRKLKANSSKHTLVLSEVEEKKDMVEDEPEQEGGDSVSVISSAWASNLSRVTSHSSSSESESGKAKEKETEKETDIAAVNPQLNTDEANEGSSGVSGIFQAAHRAKVKWLSLANSSTPSKEPNGPTPPSPVQVLITRTKSLTRRSSVKKNRRPATLAGSKVPVVEKLSTRFAVTSSVSVPAGDCAEPVSASSTAEDTSRKSTSSLTTEIVKGSSEVVTKIVRNISRSSVTRKGHHNRDVQNIEELSKGIYDSSSKRRVPSWCDRILYKSTVIPPPDPEPESATPTLPLQESPSGLLRSGQRVGQFFANAFKSRNRRESVSSFSTTAINAPNTSPNGSPVLNLERRGSGPRGREKPLPAIPVPLEMSSDSAGATFSAPSHPVHNNDVNCHSKRRSTDPVHGTSPALAPPDIRRRSASGPLPAVTKAPSPGPPALPMPELDPQPVPAAVGPRRWFSLQFLSAIHNLHAGPSPATRTSQAIPQVLPPPRHRKGDMVCIAYETLSDKEMRRLEGRSDHRPVIGHYAVFV